MTTDQTDAICLIQSGLDRLCHAPGEIDVMCGACELPAPSGT